MTTYKNIIRLFINFSTLIFLDSTLLIIGLFNLISNNFFVTWDKIMIDLNRKRIIMDRSNNEEYLVRYYLLFKERKDSYPFNVFIHKFLKGDDDELHDHPWSYFTLILSGGYYETVLENSREVTYWRGPGFFQKVDHTHIHTIKLKDTVTCWTLFIPFKRTSKWGFWKKDSFNEYKWVDSDYHLIDKSKNT